MPDAKAEVAKFLDWKRERDQSLAAMEDYPKGPGRWAAVEEWPPECPRKEQAEKYDARPWREARLWTQARALHLWQPKELAELTGSAVPAGLIKRWLANGILERVRYAGEGNETWYRWRKDC